MQEATRRSTEFVYEGRSLQMRKTKRGRLTCCFSKLGVVYLREYIHQILKPEFILILYSGAVKVINAFKTYHLIFTIFILTFDQ